jgi:hypothetical protein
MTVPKDILAAAVRLRRSVTSPDAGGMSEDEAVDYAFDDGTSPDPSSDQHNDLSAVAAWVIRQAEVT